MLWMMKGRKLSTNNSDGAGIKSNDRGSTYSFVYSGAKCPTGTAPLPVYLNHLVLPFFLKKKDLVLPLVCREIAFLFFFFLGGGLMAVYII
jgi:hypothetical protein